MRLLVDTDMFAKLGVANLLERFCELFDAEVEECGRLPALPHMLRRGSLPALLGEAGCSRLVPLAESMKVAAPASVEWLDRLVGTPQIDPGEAQLFASAAENGLFIATGDKRSTVAVARIPEIVTALSGRVVSLEAALQAMCRRFGVTLIRDALRPILPVDKMIRVCFSADNADPLGALGSYVRDLERSASPLVLWGI